MIGTSCSGKTTFARRLGPILGAPQIELDALHWGADWTPRPDFRERVDQATRAQKWIVDGNYSAVRPLLWSRATTAIWLNYGFGTTMGRALSRTLRRAFRSEPLYAGNRESLQKAFLSHESILLWVLTTHGPRRRSRELG